MPRGTSVIPQQRALIRLCAECNLPLGRYRDDIDIGESKDSQYHIDPIDEAELESLLQRLRQAPAVVQREVAMYIRFRLDYK